MTRALTGRPDIDLPGRISLATGGGCGRTGLRSPAGRGGWHSPVLSAKGQAEVKVAALVLWLRRPVVH